jgi:hypothetical protein
MSNEQSLVAPRAFPSAGALAHAGAPEAWARDLAVVGGVSAVAATLGFGSVMAVPVGMYAIVAGVSGVVTGALLGAVAGKSLRGPLSRVPVAVVLAGGLGVGALWGGAVGAIAGAALGAHGAIFRSSVEIAAVAGAIQLGWWWLPYLLRRAHERSTWPVIAFATLISPFLGWIALYVLSFLYRL